MSKPQPLTDGSEALRNTSYIELMSKISRVRQMDVKNLSVPEVAERIKPIMVGYATMTSNVTLTGLCRARKNIREELWSSTGELWYPSASKLEKLGRRGRFNDIGKPIFYACDHWIGAVFEVRPQAGDLVTLLITRTRDRLVTLNNAHIGLERLNAPLSEKRQRSQALRRNPKFQEFLKQDGIAKKWLLIDNFLSDMATDLFTPETDQDKYKITNAISDHLLTIPGVQGLIYPSVAASRNCLNLCLLPHVADQYFIPTEAWVLKVVEQISRGYKCKTILRSESIAADGQINWSSELENVQPDGTAFFRSPLTEL